MYILKSWLHSVCVTFICMYVLYYFFYFDHLYMLNLCLQLSIFSADYSSKVSHKNITNMYESMTSMTKSHFQFKLTKSKYVHCTRITLDKLKT